MKTSVSFEKNNSMAVDLNIKGWVYSIMRILFINNFFSAVQEQAYVDYTYTEDITEIRRKVNTLPSAYKELYSMHIAGFDYKEIARKLNLPLRIVKIRISFAKSYLQTS
ncbi:RNA polymerase sigma factor [Bacteroides sp. 224]|uniref:RNA polymerase sigma factor n=1 Tax=Bacteroides sp. 224 TaxID=2302936 RepID=UPI001EF366A1|nr:sigma factor-like helix-turn-helix DNA-binding protein [Bacteroides sp. 224]